MMRLGAMLGLVLLAGACERAAPTGGNQRPAGGSAGAGDATGIAAWVKPLETAPISFYQERCAACHGDYGENYLPDAYRKNGVAGTRQAIDQMYRVNLGMTPTPLDIEVDLAFRLSVLTGAPFVALTANSPGEGLAGEVSPGSTVSLGVGDTVVEAKVDGHGWTLSPKALEALAGKGDLSTARLSATREGRTTTVLLRAAAFAGPPAP